MASAALAAASVSAGSGGRPALSATPPISCRRERPLVTEDARPTRLRTLHRRVDDVRTNPVTWEKNDRRFHARNL